MLAVRQAAQQQYLLKKKQEAQARGLKGAEAEEETMSAREPSEPERLLPLDRVAYRSIHLACPSLLRRSARDAHLFKQIPEPSRLESLLITNQMQAYCQQISQFTGQATAAGRTWDFHEPQPAATEIEGRAFDPRRSFQTASPFRRGSTCSLARS